MNFLKTLFWIAITVIAVVFATNNWRPVSINLWAGQVADANLPVALFIAFLIGFLPTWAWHRAKLWHLRRQLPAPIPSVPSVPPTPVIDAVPARPIAGSADAVI
ncbi:LapA family protein [Sphingomonas naphthae]|uniref:LapA family protein n=1 Tax=Sphingomonas naphthae TaxID=1813468 RepID=A0ABY7TGT6_9SPHN|nr:LapA family protein [Sphingomonas naphthae]WCT72026.1 LapA family protein [Sphingomonas naphthae]